MSFGSTDRQPAPTRKLAGVDETTTNTNQEAVPVAYVAGRRRVALHWFTPAYNQKNIPTKTKTGKSDEQTTGYTYEVDLAGMLCMGGRQPVRRLFKLIVDRETIWENASGLARGGAAYEPIAMPKFVTAARIYWGKPDQPVDTLVLTPKAAAPADPDFDPRDYTTWPDNDRTQQHPH